MTRRYLIPSWAAARRASPARGSDDASSVSKSTSIACRRIEQAQRQADLFVSRPAPKPTVTADLFAAPPCDPDLARQAEAWREPEGGK